MMRLNHISFVQYRNYAKKEFNFSHNIIAFCGKNGVGKTNILDAIYTLSFCKSYFGRTDASNVMHQCYGYKIEAQYALHHSSKQSQIKLLVKENGKKELWVDDDLVEKFSQHIGHYPCVMIAPDDVELISGGSEGRRKFIDALLCQINPTYLQALIAYNQILLQRNALLKQMQTGVHQPNQLLEVLTQQLVQKGNYIYSVRKQTIPQIIEVALQFYLTISNGSTDEISCNYISQLDGDKSFELLLNQSLQQDIYLQRTSVGIHKDDMEFTLEQKKFKTLASQGQRKSLLIALKLAEWQILQQHKQYYPILLLDDIFEKLDNNRLHHLMQIVTAENKGQIFITDTNSDRITQHFDVIGKNIEIINI